MRGDTRMPSVMGQLRRVKNGEGMERIIGAYAQASAEGIEANASAIRGMEARVKVAEDAIESYARIWDEVESEIKSLDGKATLYSRGLEELSSYVSDINGRLVSETAKRTDLESVVNAINYRVSGLSNATQQLHARIEANEEGLTESESAFITRLNNTVKVIPRNYLQAEEPEDPRAGDIWFDSDDGLRQWRYDGTTWVEIPRGTGVTTYAQDEEPVGGAVGDLWIDTDDGNRPYRWDGTDWVDVSDQRTIANSNAIASLQSAVTTKARVFVQASEPTADGPGDLWLDSDDGYEPYRWTGTLWLPFQQVSGTKTYAQDNEPSGGNEGDLWVDTNDGNRTYRHDGDDWVEISDGRIGSIASDLTQLSTTVGNHTTTLTQYGESIDGIEGRYGIVIDNNGVATGVELLSGSGGTSQINFMADQVIFSGSQSLTDKISDVESSAESYADSAITSFSNSLGDLAWDNVVEKAKLGNTIIEGGYLKNELIETGRLVIRDVENLIGNGTPNGYAYWSTAASFAEYDTGNHPITDRNYDIEDHQIIIYSNATGAIYNHRVTPLVGGSVVRLTFEARRTSTATSGRVHVRYRIDNPPTVETGSNSYVRSASVTLDPATNLSTDWQTYSVEVTVPEGDAMYAGRVYLTVNQPLNGGTFRVRNLRAARKTDAAHIVTPSLSALSANLGHVNAGTALFGSGGAKLHMGDPSGSANQFLIWCGPDVPENQWTESNAVFYLRTDGSGYFAGNLGTGTFINSGQGTSISASAYVEVGPFATNGGAKHLNYGYAYSSILDVSGDAGTSQWNISATVALERKIGSGSWATIRTHTVNGGGSKSYHPDLDRTAGSETMSGAWTWTDTNSSTSDHTYRLKITARSVQLSDGSISQSLSFHSLEE